MVFRPPKQCRLQVFRKLRVPEKLHLLLSHWGALRQTIRIVWLMMTSLQCPGRKKNHLFWGKSGMWWSEACLKISVFLHSTRRDASMSVFLLWQLIHITVENWSICFNLKCQNILAVNASKLIYSFLSFFCCCCLLFALFGPQSHMSYDIKPSYYCESGDLLCLSHHRMSNGCSHRIFTTVQAAVWRAAVSSYSYCHMGRLSCEHLC